MSEWFQIAAKVMLTLYLILMAVAVYSDDGSDTEEEDPEFGVWR